MIEKMFYAAIKYGWNEAKKAFFFLVTIKLFFLWVEEGPQESSSLGSKDEGNSI